MPYIYLHHPTPNTPLKTLIRIPGLLFTLDNNDENLDV